MILFSSLSAHAVFAALCAAAAAADLRARRVPDAVSIALVASGVAAGLAVGHAVASIAGAAVGLALLLPAFARRWVGGGDVKLLAGLGAWLGPVGAAETALLGLVLGGALAAAMAVRAGAAARTANRVRRAIATRTAPVASHTRALTVPLAVPMVIAAAAVQVTS